MGEEGKRLSLRVVSMAHEALILKQRKLIKRHLDSDLNDSDKKILLNFDKRELGRISGMWIVKYRYKYGKCINGHEYTSGDLVFKGENYHKCWKCGELVLTEWESDIIEVQAGEALEELKDICKECGVDV